MSETITTAAFMQEVLNSYKRTASLQKTAAELKISYSKVRKILITMGEYSTDFSLEVGKRRRLGKSIAEIAAELNTSANRVTAFLPYEKSLYAGPESTTNARKSNVYRNRIRIAREKFVNKAANKDEKKILAKTVDKFVTNKFNSNTDAYHAVRLHLELKHDYLLEAEEKAILKRYGESSTGDSLSRDVLIPSDMPLHNLHYAIQRLFGWQNSHLRKFSLPKQIYDRLTNGTVKGWMDLVGILFQPPSEWEEDIFWDDDYQNGSIKTWLKKKYTGPYFFRGGMEGYEWAQNDVKQLMEHSPMIDVKDSFQDCLLERLETTKLLAFKGEEVCINTGYFPVTDELIYNYDFGDDWRISITKEKDCEELLQKGCISQEELGEAEATVLAKHKPVCIHRDGIFVFDNVGGLSGFINFLKILYESKDKEERNHYKTWSQDLGWSKRKVSNNLIL